MVVTARRVLGTLGCCLGLMATGNACGVTVTPSKASGVVIPPLVGTEPNGEQLRTGPQLVSDARASLAGAATVHLTGSLELQGVSTPVDVISDRAGDVTGSLGGSTGALQIQFSRSTGEAYIRPTGDASELVSRLGLPGATAGAAPKGDFWALDTTDAASFMALTQLGLPDLASMLLPASLVATPAITAGDVDGTPIVLAAASTPSVDEAQALHVSVAVTGDVRLVRLTGGAAAAALDVEVGKSVAPPLPTPASTPNP